MKFDSIKSFYRQQIPPKDKSTQVQEFVQNAIDGKREKRTFLIPAVIGIGALLMISIVIKIPQQEKLEMFQVESIISMENHTAIWLEPLNIQNGN